MSKSVYNSWTSTRMRKISLDNIRTKVARLEIKKSRASDEFYHTSNIDVIRNYIQN